MDYQFIQKIIKDFEASSLTAFELETAELKIKLQKDGQKLVKEQNEPKTISQNSHGYEVKSPLVGTFYSAPNPKEQPFVRVGQKVKEGDPICIIEAMKIMNEITAPVSGIITEIKVSNNEAVGIDQVLMVIDTK
ncbi:MAG TPA: biotin/lipoyl-containing protein [Bacilli bacterium]